MRRMLLALSMLLAGAAPVGDRAGARVEAVHGRARLVGGENAGDAAGELVQPGAAVRARSAARLEVGAGAESAVHWDGIASVRLAGPALLVWTDGRSAVAQASGHALECTLVELGQAWFEVRDGPVSIALPNGWTGELERGAFRIQACSDGTSEIENAAGLPVRVVRRPDPFVVPAVVLAAGERARLPAAAPGLRGRPRASDHVPAWPTVDWPFFAHGVPLVEEAARSPEPRAEPALTAIDPPREAVDALVAPARELPAPSAAPAFDPTLWRGLRIEQLARWEELAFEHSPFATRVEASGRCQVELDVRSPRSTFCFGPDRDVELLPGALAVFDPAGRLIAHVGGLRIHPAPAGRPRLDAVFGAGLPGSPSPRK